MENLKSIMILTLVFASKGVSEKCLVNTSKVFFPKTLGSETINIQKIWDDSLKKILIKSNNINIQNSSDLRFFEKKEEEKERAQYGNLKGHLKKILDYNSNSDSLIKVRVAYKYPQVVYKNPKLHSPEEIKEQNIEISRLRPITNLDNLKKKHKITKAVVANQGEAVLEIKASNLHSLAFDTTLASTWPEIEKKVELLQSGTGYPQLNLLGYSAYRNTPQSFYGAGAKVATLEQGLSRSFVQCSGLCPTGNPQDASCKIKYYDTLTTSVPDPVHSILTFRTLSFAAPGAKLYHFAKTYYELFVIDTLIARGIESVSMSVARYSQSFPWQFYDANVTEFLWIDDAVFRAPGLLFVHPTANAGFERVAHWQNFNGLSVGNIKDDGISIFKFANYTQTRNPPRMNYGSFVGPCLQPEIQTGGQTIGCAGDREMPHIVAPGLSPGPSTYMKDPCVDSTFGGTSLSAPLLSGVAASVIAANPYSMRGNSLKVKAALLVTAENVDGGEWDMNIDGRDGAGVVNGSTAMEFAAFHEEAWDGRPIERGMDADYVPDSYFNGPSKNYKIKMPSSLPSGKHLRIVLTWHSTPDLNKSINYISDLDLSFLTSSQYYSSASYLSNVEIIDVPRAQLTPGATYDAFVSFVTNRRPSSSRTLGTNMVIAWTWVADHAR